MQPVSFTYDCARLFLDALNTICMPEVYKAMMPITTDPIINSLHRLATDFKERITIANQTAQSIKPIDMEQFNNLEIELEGKRVLLKNSADFEQKLNGRILIAPNSDNHFKVIAEALLAYVSVANKTSSDKLQVLYGIDFSMNYVIYIISENFTNSGNTVLCSKELNMATLKTLNNDGSKIIDNTSTMNPSAAPKGPPKKECIDNSDLRPFTDADFAAGTASVQGDIYIARIPSLPKSAKLRQDKKLAPENTRGAQHIITTGKCYDCDPAEVIAMLEETFPKVKGLLRPMYVGPVFVGEPLANEENATQAYLGHPEHGHQSWTGENVVCATYVQRSHDFELAEEKRAQD